MTTRWSTLGNDEPKTQLERFAHWVRDNPTVAISLVPLLITGVRLLGVTRGQIEPALFILAHGDKFSILLGTFLPWIPILSTFYLFAFFRLGLVSTRLRRANKAHGYPQYPQSSQSSHLLEVFGFTFCLALSATLLSFSSLLMAILFAGFCLDIDRKGIFTFLFRWRKSRREREQRVFIEDGVPLFVLVVVVVSLLLPFLPASHYWLPAENVRMANGQVYSGIVVSSDSEFTYLLNGDLTPKVVRTVWIQERTACRIDKFEDPPLRFYFDHEVPVHMPSCSTPPGHSI